MSGQLISPGINAAAVAGVDDVYFQVLPPVSAQVQAAPTNLIVNVGAASWGPVNTLMPVGSPAELLATYGPPNLGPYNVATDVYVEQQIGCNNIEAIRITDGTDVAAIITVNDATGFATGALTIGGTAVTVGDSTLVTLTPASGSAIPVTYAATAADVAISGTLSVQQASVAANLAAAINASPAVVGSAAFLQRAFASGANVQLTSLTTGVSAISTTASASPGGAGHVTITPTGVTTLAGGAVPGVIATIPSIYTGTLPNGAPGSASGGSAYVQVGGNTTTGSPTFTVSTSLSNGSASETFVNIVAYATPGGGYSAPTFIANLVKAILGTPALSALRPASANWLAIAGTSTALPLTNTYFYATGGTSGATFTNGVDSYQLGNDLTNPKTGMYAMSGQVNGGQFGFAGNTDVSNIAAPMIAFANRENAAVVLPLPTGISVNGAIAAKNNAGIADYHAIVMKDFIRFTDSVNNVSPRQISSVPFVLAQLARTSPEQSPANKNISFITGTEHTDLTPYTPTDLWLLEQNGINVITLCPGGAPFGIRHNKNSLGPNDPRGNIAYTSMTKFLVASLNTTLLGQFIGMTQTQLPNDPVRAKLNSLVSDFMANALTSGLIQAFGVLCNLTNNTPASIGSGLLYCALLVKYLDIIDRLVFSMTGGQTVNISVQPTQLTSTT